MPRHRAGLPLLSVGVVLLFLGLYGFAGRASLVVALLGLCALVVGGVLTLVRVRRAALCPPHIGVVAVAGLALALHGYEATQLSASGFEFGALLWSLVPYLLCLALSSFRATHAAAIGGAVAALCIDAFTHYEVFINPTSSTASLALLFMPLWNTLVFAPVATAVVWLSMRRRAQRGQSAL